MDAEELVQREQIVTILKEGEAGGTLPGGVVRRGITTPSYSGFISEDPIEFDGGFNLYAYVGDDPIDFGDPLGLGKKPPRRPRPGKPPCPPVPPKPPTPPPPKPPTPPPPQPKPEEPRKNKRLKQLCLLACALEYAAELALCAALAETGPLALLCATEATIVTTACRNKCNREYPE